MTYDGLKAGPGCCRGASVWLKDFKQGWTYTGMHGKSLKLILKKLESIATGDKKDVFAMFVYLCKNLPDWYKDKDLPILNSKFNEIVTEIKNKKNGNTENKSKFA